MRFSVLVPVYGVEKYITECLLSLEKQTFKDFEVILVDDGTPDQSGVICDKFAEAHSNFKVIHKKNEGLISARRIGIQNASGEYCVFCDSDDFLELDALENLNKVIESYSPDLIIYKGYEFDGNKKTPFVESGIKEGWITEKEIIYDHFFLDYSINPLCFKTVKREIIDIDKDYSKFYKSNLGEDLLQSVPLIKKAHSIYYLDKYLYNYRNGSGMMGKYNPNYYWEYKAVNQEIKKVLQNENIIDFEAKSSFYILMAAYGAITQFKYSDRVDVNELNKVKNDIYFKDAYNNVLNKKNRISNLLKIKQLFILKSLYKGRYNLIDLSLKIPRYINKKNH